MEQSISHQLILFANNIEIKTKKTPTNLFESNSKVFAKKSHRRRKKDNGKSQIISRSLLSCLSPLV